MPVLIFTPDITIVTQNINLPPKILRHRLLRNLHRPPLPSNLHRLPVHNRLLTDGTTVVEVSEGPETVRVYCVSTGQILRRESRRVHVLAADRAAVFVLVLEAAVV